MRESRSTLVLGATGRVGGTLVRLLAERGEVVHAAARDPGRQHLPERVRPVAFDFEQKETFAPALEGVDRVFLMARPGDDEADRFIVPFIEEMVRRRIRRVVNLTGMGVERWDSFPLRKVERALESSGIAFTHLRPNFMMQNFASGPQRDQMRASGEIRIAAGDGQTSFVDVRDVAAVAATALIGSGHEGRAYTLTGPEALGYAEVALEVSKATGRTIRYVALSEEEARAELVASGWRQEAVERRLGFLALVRKGEFAVVTGDIEAVLGCAPLPFRRFAIENAAAWSEK